jgi:hypothetical protein
VGGVRGAQMRVGLVKRVAEPVLLERLCLGGELRRELWVARPPAVGDAVLVRVVAEVHDEVEVLAGDLAVGGIEALLPLLARHEAEPQLVDAAARRRARAAHRARRVAAGEAVEVLAPGVQPVDLDVDRVRERRPGGRPAARDDAAHPGILRQIPAHLDRPWLHAAVGAQRLRREPRPQHDSVVRRIARRDAEHERVGAVPRRPAVREVERKAAERGGERQRAGAQEDAAAGARRRELLEPPVEVKRRHGRGIIPTPRAAAVNIG